MQPRPLYFALCSPKLSLISLPRARQSQFHYVQSPSLFLFHKKPPIPRTISSPTVFPHISEHSLLPNIWKLFTASSGTDIQSLVKLLLFSLFLSEHFTFSLQRKTGFLQRTLLPIQSSSMVAVFPSTLLPTPRNGPWDSLLFQVSLSLFSCLPKLFISNYQSA